MFSVFEQQEKRLFTNFHRQLFCWLDRWVDLTMDDIRRMEEETQRELDQVKTLYSVSYILAQVEEMPYRYELWKVGITRTI